MKKILLTLLLFSYNMVLCQSWEWARKATTTSSAQTAGEICVDAAGNVYALAVNSGTASYNPDNTNPGTILIKYDNLGFVIWATNLSYPASKIGTDQASNIYLSGNYQNTITTATSSFTSTGSFDFFLVKLNSQGTEIWSKSYGGPSSDQMVDLAVDHSGNTYFTGSYKSDTLIFNNYNSIDTSSYGNFYLAKINSSGITQWVDRGIQDSAWYHYNSGDYLAIDKFDRVYVHGTATVCNNIGCSGHFLAKYNGNGNRFYNNFKWIGYLLDAYQLEIDDSLNVYTIVNGGHHAGAGSLRKYDSLLNMKWGFGLGPQYGCYGFGAPRVTPAGKVFITGTLRYEPGFSGCSYNTQDSVYLYNHVQYLNGKVDVIVGQLNNGGQVSWFKRAGGMGVEMGYYPFADKQENYYLTGVYNITGVYTTTLNASSVFDSFILPNDGTWQQMFVAKLGAHDIVGINSYEINKQKFFYPNPASDKITIDIKDETQLTFINSLGQIVSEHKLDQSTELNISHLSKGIYIVMASHKNSVQTQKLIIE